MPKGAFYVFPNVSDVLEDPGAVDAFAGLPEDVQVRSSPTTGTGSGTS